MKDRCRPLHSPSTALFGTRDTSERLLSSFIKTNKTIVYRSGHQPDVPTLITAALPVNWSRAEICSGSWLRGYNTQSSGAPATLTLKQFDNEQLNRKWPWLFAYFNDLVQILVIKFRQINLVSFSLVAIYVCCIMFQCMQRASLKTKNLIPLFSRRHNI